MDLWTREDHADLLMSRPYLGKVASPHSRELTPFHHDDLWQSAVPPAGFTDADRVFIFGQHSARLMRDRLSRRLSTPVHWIQSFPGPENPVHVTEFLHRQVWRILGPLKEGFQRILPSPEQIKSMRSWLSAEFGGEEPGPVFIHPGSGGRRKVWPLPRWYAVIKWLRLELAVPVVLTLGPADDRIRVLAQEAMALGARVAEGLRLPELAALLSLAKVFVGSDSGVSHLAAAVGTPTVVVFGNSDHRVWSPLGPHVRVVHDNWLESEVFEWPAGACQSMEIERVKGIVRQWVEQGGRMQARDDRP